MFAYIKRWQWERAQKPWVTRKDLLLPGELSVCMLCGAVQDMMNGLGHGSCGLCLHGMLAGWSQTGGTCSYAGCEQDAVAWGLRGKWKVCRAHAEGQGIGVKLDEVIASQIKAYFIEVDYRAPLHYHARRYVETHPDLVLRPAQAVTA